MLLLSLLHLKELDIPAENCSDWELRLVEGETDNEGRLEICYNNAWSTACGDRRWDEDFTEDVCRELGYVASGEHLCRAFLEVHSGICCQCACAEVYGKHPPPPQAC